MEKYVIIKKGVFESLEKFQKKINDQAQKGYRAISMATHNEVFVLMEKTH